MTTNLRTQEDTRRYHSSQLLSNLVVSFHPFGISDEKLSELSNFSTEFEFVEYQLGECAYDKSESGEKTVQDEQNAQYLYLVVEGRVRLLSFDPEKEREVSIQVLSEGEMFGGDECFWQNFLGYRAIAASTVQVARISLEQLSPWLEQLPKLAEQWREVAQYRQTLIFFKTLTELRSLSSSRLEQLLPYIEQKTIPAETPLNEVPEVGHYWLREGEIETPNASISEMGLSWGYPKQPPNDWVAKTDLLVNFVPESQWEMVIAIAPNLSDSNGGKQRTRTVKPKAEKPTIPVTASPKAQRPSLDTSDIEPSNTEVDFPKPLKRRHTLWRSYPYIEQQSAADCGAACLAMISQYWGKRLSINFIRNLAGVGRQGASLKNLSQASERLGYQARPVRASLDSLTTEKKPWIAHWEGDHYIVVYGFKKNKILVADPARGKRLISRQEFVSHWTGYALLLDPTERLLEVPSQKRSLGRFMQVLLPYRSVWTQVIVASLLIQVFGLITPLFTQIILDQVVVNRSLSSLHVFALGALIFSIWSVGLTAIRQYLLSYLSNRLDLTLISGFIRHTLLLPLKFFESRHVGDILTRVQENQKIQRFLISKVILAWLDFLMGFVYLGLMLYYNWRLTLLVVGLIPLIVIVTVGATPLLRKVSRDVFNQSAAQNSALVETINGVATVKTTTVEREVRWRWEDRLTSFLNARFKSQKLGIGLQAASGMINTFGKIGLLWYGAYLVIQGDLTIGQFVAFNMLIGKVLSPVISLSNLWDELQEVLISVERLNDIFDSQPEETPGQPLLALPTLKGEVCFDHVTFRYEGDEKRNTLENITFNVKEGETVAIVGRSGSGKSTLVKLLQGLYHPINGRIWMDGHDIRHVSPQSLRSQFGVVPQECFLFSGTILENITLFRSGLSLEDAVEAAKLAEAHAFIQSMTLGYNTKVGERGANLSGGQRQRIAIARALIGKPQILILDEATSSLDTESERRFQDNLERLSRDRTTFIIAHRLSTVRNADRILVLDKGILVEEGNHDELMAEQGLYYQLAQQQLNL